jgi:hypothetical protein
MYELIFSAISRIRLVITERAVLRYCGKFTLATLFVMTGLIRDIAIFSWNHEFDLFFFFFEIVTGLIRSVPFYGYTLSGGMASNVWFDRLYLGLDVPEEPNSVNEMAVQLGELINEEVKSGIPLNRIIIGNSFLLCVCVLFFVCFSIM